MFDIRDFSFVLVKNEKTGDIHFIIDFTEEDTRDSLYLDTVNTWISDVKEKVESGKTVEDVINDFRESWWNVVVEDPKEGIRGNWNKAGRKVDEESYQKAVEQYFGALRALAYGAVRDKSLPITCPVQREPIQGVDYD